MTDQPNPAAPPPAPDPADAPGPSWPEPSLPPVEPAEGSAPAQVVAGDTYTFGGDAGTGRRMTGVRWAIALGVIAIVVGITIAILALTSGKPSTSIAVGYMPDDTIQYGEYRLDLPGDQAQKLAAFLSKFPGFADQSAVQPKLYEVFDRIVAAASSNSQTFTADIEPWFGGQIATGNGGFDAGSLSGGASAMGLGNPLVVITIKDPAKANAWLQKTLAISAPTSSYGGASLYEKNGFVAAVTDKVILGGSDATVRAAIDTNGNGNLGNDPEFKAALSSISHDYVAFSFMDYRSYLTSIVRMSAGSTNLDSTTIDEAVLGLVPAWVGGALRFENDSIVADGAYPSVDIGYEAKNRASTLTGHVPSSTLFYAETHDVGAALTAFLGKLRAIPELSSAFAQIDQTAGLIGGIDGLVGWWGDTALAVGPNSDGSIGGGLLIAPTDASAARRTFDTLRSFIVLGGGQAGITIRDEPHGDATITIIDLSAALAASGGVPAGVKAELSYTVTDHVVVIGYGSTFVTSVLDAGPGTSLADTGRFKDLLARVGAENLGLTFVDIQAIRSLIEPLAKGLAPADQWAYYEKEIVPYVSHLDALVSSSRIDGGLNRLPMAVTLK